jgi:hypothetical protein
MKNPFIFIKSLFKMTPEKLLNETPVIQTAENEEVPTIEDETVEWHAPESEEGEHIVAPVVEEEVEKKINVPAQAIADVINELTKLTPMQVNGTFNAMMNTLKEAKRLAESL